MNINLGLKETPCMVFSIYPFVGILSYKVNIAVKINYKRNSKLKKNKTYLHGCTK